MKTRLAAVFLIFFALLAPRALCAASDGAYELTYTLTGRGSAAITLADGGYRLAVEHSDSHNDEHVMLAGEKIAAGVGRYKICVNEGYAELYYNGHYAGSAFLERSDETEALTVTENGLSVGNAEIADAPGREILYELSGTLNDKMEIPTEYAAEFDTDTKTLMIYDGTYRLVVYLTDGVQVMESTDNSKTAVKRKIGELPSADARCRVSVSHGMATFYADGRAMGSFRMQKSTVAAQVRRTGGSGSVIIRKNRDRYYYGADGIADDGCWEIEQIGTARRALLQTAGKNASFEMKIRPIVRAGKLRVHMGYVRDSISCIAEYDFAGGEWSMRVVTDQKFEENYTAAKPLPEGELTIGSYVSDRSIVLAVNGERIFDVSSRINPTGRVGLETDGCTVEVSSVSYSGESMVVPGAVSRDFADLHTVEFIPLGGEVYMAGMNEQTKRLSGGEWVGGVYQRFTHNTLVLADGSIVAIDYADGETADTYWDEAWVSTDGGVTFDGPYRIETEESNRITMNNKLTELSDGRLIFCAGESGHAQEVEGQLGLYYSDDGGRSWRASDNNLTIFNTGVNVQEGKVVEMPDGLLRCYVRTDLGFLYYSTSYDRGVSWSLSLEKTDLTSPLCAMNIERDPEDENTYYMFWEYDNSNLIKAIQNPRTRAALAVSYDGCESWEYVCDLTEMDIWTKGQWHANHGIRVIGDKIYLNVVIKDTNSVVTMRVWELDKNVLKTYRRFPSLHLKA